MWDEILNLAIKNGLWAVLFLGLFIFVIRDSSNREKKYQQTIKDLTSHLGIVKEIKEDVDEIKNVVFNNKKNSAKSKKISKNDKKVQKSTKKVIKTKNFAQKDKNSLIVKVEGNDEK